MGTFEFIIAFTLMAIGVITAVCLLTKAICLIFDRLLFDKIYEEKQREREAQAAEWLGTWGP